MSSNITLTRLFKHFSEVVSGVCSQSSGWSVRRIVQIASFKPIIDRHNIPAQKSLC
jgi:hypothetical protein